MGKILHRKTVIIQYRIKIYSLGKFAWSSMDFWWYKKKENILKHHGKKYTFFSPRVLPQREVKHEYFVFSST